MQESSSNVPAEVMGSGEIMQPETDIIAVAEKRLDRYKKIADLSLKVTTQKDWVDQSGNPYLVHSGAEKIARLFGISITGIKHEKMWAEDEKGGKFFMYRTTGSVSLPDGTCQEALGICSSRDSFFGKSHGEFKLLSQLDEPSIAKAAYTNMVVNGITHLLGLRNITWEQLSAVGIRQDGIAKVDYQAGKQGGSKKADMSSEGKSKLDEIKDMVSEMCQDEQDQMAKYFGEISSFKYKDKKTGEEKPYSEPNPARWSEKVLNIAFPKIKAHYDSFVERYKDAGGQDAE